jgi:hypothetical protein
MFAAIEAIIGTLGLFIAAIALVTAGIWEGVIASL